MIPELNKPTNCCPSESLPENLRYHLDTKFPVSVSRLKSNGDYAFNVTDSITRRMKPSLEKLHLFENLIPFQVVLLINNNDC